MGNYASYPSVLDWIQAHKSHILWSVKSFDIQVVWVTPKNCRFQAQDIVSSWWNTHIFGFCGNGSRIQTFFVFARSKWLAMTSLLVILMQKAPSRFPPFADEQWTCSVSIFHLWVIFFLVQHTDPESIERMLYPSGNLATENLTCLSSDPWFSVRGCCIVFPSQFLVAA